MGAAVKELWERKAQSPGEHDLISIMLQSDAMSHMSHEEFMGTLILLIVGGNDTTRNSMSAYAYGLHSFPEERAKLDANHDPDLAKTGRAHVLTPVHNAHVVCRLLLAKNNATPSHLAYRLEEPTYQLQSTHK